MIRDAGQVVIVAWFTFAQIGGLPTRVGSSVTTRAGLVGTRITKLKIGMGPDRGEQETRQMAFSSDIR